MHLDELGSFVWKRFDGQRTIDEIAQAMPQDDPDDVRHRLLVFVRRLERERLIRRAP